MKYDAEYKGNKPELDILCVNSKCGNFTKGKVYHATAYSCMLNGKYADFRIEDDDHDLFTITQKNLNENSKLYFNIVEKDLEQEKDDMER